MQNWTDFLSKLSNPLVKDLFWSLASPCPIKEFRFPQILFPSALNEIIVAEHLDYFLVLDKNPKVLVAFLAQNLKTNRLGFYFECLLHFFFKNSPFINCLLANKQVIEEGRTLGEVDFVIEFKEKVYHLEVAVKFYLNQEYPEKLENWIGPGGKDTLKKKLDKVQSLQFPIAKHTQIKEIIKCNYQSFLFLKGKFYSRTELPSWANCNSEFGHFYFSSEFKKQLINKTNELVLLNKPNWLADLVSINKAFSLSKKDALDLLTEIEGTKKALHLGELRNNKMCSFFVINNNWPIVK